MIDHLPTVSLVLEQLQTWDTIVIYRDSSPKTYHGLNSIGHRTALDIGHSCYKRSSTLAECYREAIYT